MASTYLSDDRHEVRLVNVLLVVLIEKIVFRAKDNQRHKAVAIFLRQDVLLLSRAGVQINLVPERVNEGANRSLLLESIRHVLEGKSTIAHVEHATGSINAWIDATTALAALAALGGLWGLGALGRWGRWENTTGERGGREDGRSAEQAEGNGCGTAVGLEGHREMQSKEDNYVAGMRITLNE